jgi:hypothetical protein
MHPTLLPLLFLFLRALLCHALSSPSSSYLSPHTPLLFCSRPPLPFLPSSTSSNRATRCHGCRRPYSPWAAIISPSPLSSTPCRASPLPTGAPRSHPGANPSLDGPTGVPSIFLRRRFGLPANPAVQQLPPLADHSSRTTSLRRSSWTSSPSLFDPQHAGTSPP